jgi:ketosteroid isomerase-like protein
MNVRGPRDSKEQAAGNMRIHKAIVGPLFCAILLFAVAAPVCRSQQAETCNESTVREKSEHPVPQIAAEDIYVNTTNSKQPLKSKAEVERLREALLADRKNQKPTRFYPEQIVPSKSGDMAYDYGKAHVEYDLANTGQHISYDFEYLRVWKVTGKVCRLAASFSRAERLSGIDR